MDLSKTILSEKGGQPLEVKWAIPPDSIKKLPKDQRIRSNNSNVYPKAGLNPMAAPFVLKSANKCRKT